MSIEGRLRLRRARALAAGLASGALAATQTVPATVAAASPDLGERGHASTAAPAVPTREWQKRVRADIIRTQAPAVVSCRSRGVLGIWHSPDDPSPPELAMTYGDAACSQIIKTMYHGVSAAKNGYDVPALDNSDAVNNGGIIVLPNRGYPCGDCSGSWTLKTQSKFYKYVNDQVLSLPRVFPAGSCVEVRSDDGRVSLGFSCTSVSGVLVP